MAENIPAEDALAAVFVMDVVDPAMLDQRIGEICERLSGNAPVTMRVTKEAMHRIQQANLPDGMDLCALAMAATTSMKGQILRRQTPAALERALVANAPVWQTAALVGESEHSNNGQMPRMWP